MFHLLHGPLGCMIQAVTSQISLTSHRNEVDVTEKAAPRFLVSETVEHVVLQRAQCTFAQDHSQTFCLPS